MVSHWLNSPFADAMIRGSVVGPAPASDEVAAAAVVGCLCERGGTGLGFVVREAVEG
jgi:hypothetical protein